MTTTTATTANATKTTTTGASPLSDDVRRESRREPSGNERLTIAHLAGFLLGRRESILVAARDRSTLYVGLVFVLAAGLAREYDGEDLTREPWHLLIPLAASLVLSITLFRLVRRTAAPHRRPFWSEYRAFLGLFWLTAPMAALYGIPYERFLSPVSAVSTNLWTLGLVAAWRVLLTVKVTSVFTGRSKWVSFFLVMLVADVFAAVALMIVPLPTLQVMGGVRLSEAESVLLAVGFWGQVLTVVSLPVWFIGAAIARWAPGAPPAPPELAWASHQLAKAPFILACFVALAWASLLPLTQPEQRRRHDAEQLLRSGEIVAGLAEMSRHPRDAYPPHWDPPPRVGWSEDEIPAVLDVVRNDAFTGAEPWVRAVYAEKFDRQWLTGGWIRWKVEQWPLVERAIARSPELQRLAAEHAGLLAAARADYVDTFVVPTSQPSDAQPTTRGSP